MSAIRIVPYSAAQRAAVLELSLRAWEPVFPQLETAVPPFVYEAFYPQGWRRRQHDDLASVLDDEPDSCDVALIGQQPVGWVCTRLHPEDSMGEIYVLAVDPELQRQGIGRALIDHAANRIRSAGMRMMMVETGGDPGQAAARHIYESQGFERWPVARYFKDLTAPKQAASGRSGSRVAAPASESVSLADLVARAEALAADGVRRVLGITGAPGAGKSTLAEQLVRELGPDLAVLVPMDGFHLANAVLERLGRRDRKGAIDTFDDAGFAALLERIHAQRPDSAETIYAPVFRRELEEPIGSALPVAAHVPLVITEGNYLLQDSGAWPRVRACLDEAWFISGDEEQRRARLIARHERFGKTAEAARAWALGTDERNAELIRASAHRADRIFRLA